MKMRLLAATAAAAMAFAATSANAAITVQASVANELFDLSLGGVMLEDFDGISNPNFLFTGNEITTPQNPVSTSAPPPYTGPGSISICCQSGNNYDADSTDYASVQANQVATFAGLGGYRLSSFSFYMGSPDSYNRVIFNLAGGGSQQFDGEQIWGGGNFGGDRTKGFRIYYDFGGAEVTSINFYSIGANAFEFDGLAGTAVPEPGTWALMILGFGGAGAMIRRRRAVLAAA